MEDRELIRRIQNGRKEYLNEIAEKYYDDIYYFCCYQTGSREEAYDLTQETFLRFVRYVEQYQYRNLKGYLLTIAMNLCRDYMREQAARHLEICPDASGWRFPEAEKTIGEMKGTEDRMLLFDALRMLADSQREAVLLHHFYGYKNREIACMTGTSAATVKSRVRQGLAKLEKLLNEHDFRR